MTFAFIHSADWQLGKPFGGFNKEEQVLLRRARLETIDRLAQVAQDAQAEHILIAGDVYDGDVETRTLLQPLDKMAAYKSLNWHLLPGNHDPARRGGIWDRVRAADPAGNIIIHDQAKPHEIARGVVLLPAPLHSKTVTSDPSDWMDQAPTPDGTIRIGLAHGSIRGFDSAGEAAVELSPTRDQSAGLGYLALGDWHGMTKISDRVWYSGTPEPDRYRDNQPGHALIVRLDGPRAVPTVEPISTAAFIWQSMQLSLGSADDMAPLEDEIERWGTKQGQTLLQLELSGAVSLADYAQVETRLERLSARLFHLQRRLDGLHAIARNDDLAAIGEGAVRAAADQLRTIAADESDTRAPVAELALRQLFVMVKEEAETAEERR